MYGRQAASYFIFNENVLTLCDPVSVHGGEIPGDPYDKDMTKARLSLSANYPLRKHFTAVG